MPACGSLEEAAEGAVHVQESGPESLEWKRETFARLEQVTGPGTSPEVVEVARRLREALSLGD